MPLPKDPTQIGFSKESSDGWLEACGMLVKTYRGQKKGRTDVDALFDILSHIDGQTILKAVRRHIVNTTDDRDNQPAGRWFPTPADLQKQVEFLRSQVSTATTGTRIPFRTTTTVAMDVPEDARKYFGKDKVEIWKTPDDACILCAGSGKPYYYIYPEDPDMIYMQEEWNQIYEEDIDRAKLFAPRRCICLCSAGKEIWREQNNEAYGLPHVKTILKKVKARILKMKSLHDEREGLLANTKGVGQ